MLISVLGPTLIDGSPISAPSAARVRTVLCVLASNIGRTVSLLELEDAIWGPSPPVRSDKAIQVYVSTLRRLLAPGAIVTTSVGYSLSSDVVSLDAAVFEALVTATRDHLSAGDLPRAEAQVREALELWRGDPFEDAHTHALGRFESLVELHLGCEELEADIKLELDQHELWIPTLRSNLAAQPLRERRVAQLMIALHRVGRTAEALAVYRDFDARLDTGLGIAPSPTLRALETDLLLATAPPQTARSRTDEGEDPDELIDVADDVTALLQLLDDHQVVTVEGLSGVGKSRIAMLATARWAAQRRFRLHVADLADVGDEQALLDKLLDLLGGGAREAGSLTGIFDELIEHDVLLLLDNADRVTLPCKQLADHLLERSSRARILVTACRGIDERSEGVLVRRALAVPPRSSGVNVEHASDYGAVRLFVRRAGASRPGFALTDVNLDPVLRICDAAGGNPLAINIVAALTSILTVDQIADRLHGILNDVRCSDPDAERHTSLRSCLDWYVSSLGDPSVELLMHASLFAGAFTADDVVATMRPALITRGKQNVEAELLNRLSGLIRGHLVEIEPASQDLKFRVPGVVRAWARERLDARTGDSRVGPREAFAQWVSELVIASESDEQATRFRLLEGHFDDIVACVEFDLSPDGSAPRALRVLISMRSFLPHHPAVSLRLLTRALALKTQSSDVPTAAFGWICAGEIAYIAGAEDAITYFEAGIDLALRAGDALLEVEARSSLSTIKLFHGDHVGAIAQAELALAIATSTSSRMRARAHSVLGMALIGVDTGRARGELERSLAHLAHPDDGWGRCNCVLNLGLIDLMDGEIELANIRVLAAIDAAQRGGFPSLCAWSNYYGALVAACGGEYPRAIGLLLESHRIAATIQLRQLVAHLILGWAAIALAADQLEVSLTLATSARRTALATREDWHPVERSILELVEDDGERRLSALELRTALTRGQLLNSADALEFGVTRIGVPRQAENASSIPVAHSLVRSPKPL